MRYSSALFQVICVRDCMPSHTIVTVFKTFLSRPVPVIVVSVVDTAVAPRVVLMVSVGCGDDLACPTGCDLQEHQKNQHVQLDPA